MHMQTSPILIVLLIESAVLGSHLSKHRLIDCQQFKSDLIQCFAHVLFTQNSAHFSDLPDIQSRPVLTSLFHSTKVNQGSNITFTCQTQIDALPVFLFYRLSPHIIQAYSGQNFNLSEFAQPLQKFDPDMADDYMSVVPRVTFERRVHVEDSNQDIMSDMETIHLHLNNVQTDDIGYYLCIVANSQKAFRLTYALLEVNEASQVTEIDRWQWMLELSRVELGMIVATGLSVIFLGMLLYQFCSCFHCCHCRYRDTNRKNKKLIEKTVDSMKQNLVYASMSDNTSSDSNQSSPKLNHSLTSTSPSLPSPPPTQPPQSAQQSNNDTLTNLPEDSKFEFPRDKLKLGRLIDEGAFGRVFLAEAFGILPNRYKTTVAVKTLKDHPSRTELTNFRRELAVMKSVGERHPNVVSLLGICGNYAIVEYAKYGNLRNYLRTLRPKDHAFYTSESEGRYSSMSKSSPFATDQLSTFVATASPQISAINLSVDLVKFSLNVASGMRFLHSKNILHRDLAARNVLVDEFRVAKIADFGLARDVNESYYYTRVGSEEAPLPVKWMAPESLFDRKVYASSDVWSFGVVLWEIFSLGGNPYPTVPVESLFEYLSSGKRMNKPEYCDDEVYDLIQSCWNFKPDLRPTFSQATSTLESVLNRLESVKLLELHSLLTPQANIKFNTRHTPLHTPQRLSSSGLNHSVELDSQYFTDTSLLYSDTNCSFSGSSVYSNYSVLPGVNAAAHKAASDIQAQLTLRPPSPPPIKHFSKLLNLATAAYEL